MGADQVQQQTYIAFGCLNSLATIAQFSSGVTRFLHSGETFT